MKIRLSYVALILIFALGAIYFLGGIKPRKSVDHVSTALILAQDTISRYTVKINKLEQTVFETSSITLLQREAIALGLLEQERLRKLNIRGLHTNTSLKGEIKVLKEELEHANVIRHDTIILDNDTKPCIEIPAYFSFNDPYLELDITIDRIWSFNLDVKLDLEVTVGQSVIITTPNPYVNINEIQSIYIPEEEKWHHKSWVRGLVVGGVAAGVVLLVK